MILFRGQKIFVVLKFKLLIIYYEKDTDLFYIHYITKIIIQTRNIYEGSASYYPFHNSSYPFHDSSYPLRQNSYPRNILPGVDMCKK